MRWFWIVMLWLGDTLKGLIRNFWGNITAVLLTIACLTLFSLSFVAGLNAKNFANVLNDKIEISVDLKSSVTDYQKTKRQLAEIYEVAEVRYVSKDEAFKTMEKDMGDNAEVLHALGENPFPARFIVKVKDPKNIEDVVKKIEKMDIADKMQYGKEYVQDLIAFTKTVQKVGYLVTIAAAIFTIYIVANVMKYNIDKRKDELRIKRLTGAGMLTIRLPFILEALILTACSSLIVYQLFSWGYGKIEMMIRKTIMYAPLLSKVDVLHELFYPLIGITLAIGFIGSII